MENNNYKRQYRQMSDATKQKISSSLKGRTQSPTHTEKISNGLKDYWKNIPNSPINNDNNTKTTL